MTGNVLHISSNTEARWRDHRCREKVIIITYPECVLVALIFQHAMRMRLLSSVTCPALQYFPTFSRKRNDFFEKNLKKLLKVKCVF